MMTHIKKRVIEILNEELEIFKILLGIIPINFTLIIIPISKSFDEELPRSLTQNDVWLLLHASIYNCPDKLAKNCQICFRCSVA